MVTVTDQEEEQGSMLVCGNKIDCCCDSTTQWVGVKMGYKHMICIGDSTWTAVRERFE